MPLTKTRAFSSLYCRESSTASLIATLGGEEIRLEGVVVNSGDLYVPQGAVDLID